MSAPEPTGELGPLTTANERTQQAGSVQPHGIVVVVVAQALTIECISENVEALLGRPARELCGRPLAVLLDPADTDDFIAKLGQPQLAALNPREVRLAGPEGRPLRFDCTVHRAQGGRSILEFEPSEALLEGPDYDAAHAPIERLTTARDITTLLADAARDLGAVSSFDRTLIYRFDPGWHCPIVAESAAPGMPVGFLGRRFPTALFPDLVRRLQLSSPVVIIPDCEFVAARLIGPDASAPAVPVDLSGTILGDISAEQLDYCVRMGSRATLTISILIRGRLWGLIACHSASPRRLGCRARAVCELIAHMLAWQLDARLESERLQASVRVSSLRARISAIIETTADIGAAAIEAAPWILDLFGADGIAVRTAGVIRRSGNTPRDDAALIDAAARLNARADYGVASSPAPAAALLIQLAPDGRDFVLVLRARKTEHRRWTEDDLSAAAALRGHLAARLQIRERERNAQLPPADPLGRHLTPAEALIKLHEDVAAALPSREAVTNVILAFAGRETGAGGAAMEALTGPAIVCEAATGLLAPQAGTREPRAGTLAGISADLHAPLLCADVSRELARAEREACRRLGIGSLVVVPITLSENTTIVLKVASAQSGAFGEADIQTLKLAATNLLTSLRAAQKFAALAAAEQEQRAYARRLRTLHAIASTTTSNRKDQIDAALQLGLEQLDLDWAFLGVIDYAAQEFAIENSVSRDGTYIVEVGVRAPLGSTIIGRVVRTKGVRIMHDVSQSDESAAYSGWASYIAVPLFIGGVNYGVIGFTSREARTQPFSEANVEFVAVAGELIASAVERGLQRERLESSETRYRALTEAIPEMVCVVDAADRYEYVNARWSKYTGLTLEQSQGARQSEVYDPVQLALISTGRGALPPAEYDCEVRLRRHDGAYRWHLVRSVPFRGSAGDAGKWLVTASDIEERKSAEAVMADVHDAALAATEAKSRFLATMSHEIRTPMNAVIGMTELLLLTQLSDEQREYIEIVRDSGESLLRVLNDILDYSKIEAGKLELETVHFDLPAQIESVVELLRGQYHIKGVTFTTSVGANVPAVVTGDPGRLRQILLNLAGNGLKFTAPGGAVHIDVSPSPAQGDQSGIRFTVEDTGIGIPPDLVERLFQPFSQGDESTTRKYGGTGLGLSICAQLVALMNGKIGVRSVPAQGSAFWFDLPLRSAKSSYKAHEARKRGAARSKPIVMRAERILLAEDNEINTFLALKQLQRIGFVVSAVNNGLQAVEAVKREHFDLVFMDCHMPEMDGFAATREIRQMEAGGTRHLPIVAMTADARTEDHQNCLRAGMDDYVSKPTSLEDLRTVLDRWLPTPDRRQSNRGEIAQSSPGATLRVAKLLELFGGDRGAVITLLTAAAGSIKADFARIENCAAAREFAAVAEAAHRLKGTTTSIRSPRLGEICAAVEAAAQTATETIPEALLAELRAAVEALIADVEKHTKVLTAIG